MLICLVILEMAKPGTPPELLSRWRLQRKHGDTLSPEPGDRLRRYRGRPDSRDWDALEAAKRCDGWRTISHRREFVEDHQDGERKDEVELAEV